MAGIVLVVFVAVFLIALLLLSVVGWERSKQKQMTVTRIESVVTVTPDIAVDTLDLRKHEHLSRIPWLDRLLARVNIFPRLHLLLYQADLKWTVGTLMLIAVACGMAGGLALYWRIGAGWLAMLAGLGAGTIPFIYVFHKRAQRFTAFEQLLPDALGLMVGALRAGHSFTSTIGMVSREMGQPISREFRKCFDEQMFGIDTRTAMLNMVKRVPIQPVRIIATVVLIQRESGGNLAEVLDKAAYVIRERFKLQRQVKVHTAQGRMTGWILALMPVILGCLLYMLSPERFSLLWKRDLGLKLLYGAVVMNVIGALVIRKIISIRI
ncbi:MAG TPA: type II secretion system F family protein [Bryobacteraceae bacterium]|jgi:tight adherence protein B|nr:type II secretion system F family protein [Bryobacteraceae bacterium]